MKHIPPVTVGDRWNKKTENFMIRHSSELFGELIVFDDGTMGFYDPEINDVLHAISTPRDADRFALKRVAVELDNNFHLNSPLIAYIEVTRECNLTCKHCYIQAGDRMQNELNTDEIFALIDSLKALNTFGVCISGGEPFLHPDIFRILEYLEANNFIVSLYTNGTLIDWSIVDRIARSCNINISVDGYMMNKEIRGVDFEELKSTILMFKERGFNIWVNSTVMNNNLHDLERLFDWCIKNDINYGTASFSPLGRGRQFPELEMKEDMSEKAAEMYLKETINEEKYYAAAGAIIGKLLDLCYRIVNWSKRCKGSRCLMYIAANGDVFPCSLCASTSSYLMGNIRERDLREIWQEGNHEFRKITWKDFSSCKSCRIDAQGIFCSLRCPVLSAEYNGDPLVCGATPFFKKSLLLRTEKFLEHNLIKSI